MSLSMSMKYVLDQLEINLQKEIISSITEWEGKHKVTIFISNIVCEELYLSSTQEFIAYSVLPYVLSSVTDNTYTKTKKHAVIWLNSCLGQVPDLSI